MNEVTWRMKLENSRGFRAWMGEVWDNVPDDGLTIGNVPIGERFEEGDLD